VHRENQPYAPPPHASKPLFPGEVRIEANTLIAKGVSLGQADFTSWPIHSRGPAFSVTEISNKLDNIYEDLGEYYTLAAKYVNGESISQAYVKTLLINRDKEDSPLRGFGTKGPEGWTPIYESFFGVMGLTQFHQMIQGGYHESWHELLMAKPMKESGAGLFLALARRLQNDRVLRISKGLLGLTNLDVEPGDEVIMLKRAMAPLVLRDRDRIDGQ
jgi:hypothetical protein